MLGLIAAVAESCVEEPPADARVVIEYDGESERPSIETNLTAKERACMSKRIGLTAIPVGRALHEAFSEELSADKTVTVRTPIAGLGKAPEQTLDLRFVRKP